MRRRFCSSCFTVGVSGASGFLAPLVPVGMAIGSFQPKDSPSRRPQLWVRRIAAVIAFVTAFVFLTGGNPAPDFRGRLGVLRQTWFKTAWDRRLEGTAAAYDRRFAAFLESSRGALPPDTPGLALHAPRIPEWGGLYLAVYCFAPIPVLLAPKNAPPGWLVLSYGDSAVPTGRVLRQVRDRALVLPP